MTKIDMDDQLVTKAYHISMLAIKQAEIDLLNEQFAQRPSPAPAQGWRLLEVGEVMQAGDEFLTMTDHVWEDVEDMAGTPLDEGIVRRRLTPPALTDATILPSEIGAVVDALVVVRDYYKQKVEDWEDCESCGNLDELCPEHGLMYALLLLTDPEQDADFTPYALRDAIAKAAAVTYSAVAAVREGSEK